MSDGTHISWSDATWNPASGCTKVSAGCDHCYIDRTPPFRMAKRRFDKPGIGGTTGVQMHEDRMFVPLHWRKPRRVFVNSLSDLFHADVSDLYIAKVFATMARAPQHSYQVLTKRPARMRSLLSSAAFRAQVEMVCAHPVEWPLPSVWLGVSTEDQKAADLRIPILLGTPAAVRWVSVEPLLGPVDLDQPRCETHGRDEVIQDEAGRGWCRMCAADGFSGELSYGHWLDPLNGGLQWVVAGGESGPGARPAHPDWFRTLRDQCADAGVPFHFKQRGEWTWTSRPSDPWGHRDPDTWVDKESGDTAEEELAAAVGGSWYGMYRVGKKAAGRELDGVVHDAYPAVAP